MSEPRTPVSVIGTGRLGAAIAQALLAAGHPVTVWNRSPEKTQPLAAQGAVVAGSVGAAVAASPLLITVVLDHHNVRELLGRHSHDLRGRTLVNISSSAPEHIRALAEWATGHGAEFLDGAMMAVPAAVGTPDAQLLFSGSPAVHERFGEQLAVLGATRYLGDDPGLAELYSNALLSAGYGVLFGFLHGAAMLDTAGGRPTDFLGLAVPWLNGMIAFLGELARETETGDYRTGESSLEINLAALETIVAASRATGVDPGFLVPSLELVRAGVAAGYGKDSAARVFEIMKIQH